MKRRRNEALERSLRARRDNDNGRRGARVLSYFIFPDGSLDKLEKRYVKIKYEIISGNNYTVLDMQDVISRLAKRKRSPAYRAAIMDFRLADLPYSRIYTYNDFQEPFPIDMLA